MSIGRFTELATDLADPQEVADAVKRRRGEQAERRIWPMPQAETDCTLIDTTAPEVER